MIRLTNSMYGILSKNAEKCGEKIAYMNDEEKYTWKEAKDRTDRLITLFQSWGITEGSTAAIAEVKGMQKKGVIAVLKHFAFNDEEAARNGISIWLNEQSAREIYLLPFEYAMRPSMGGAVGAMSSFNRVGALWTGASEALQITLSRDEWDYQGYFITDMAASNGALFMTYDDGIFNGTDLFLGSGSKTALKDWKSNIAFRNRVREAVHRVLYVTVNYSMAMNGITANSTIVSIMPWWELLLIIAIIAFGVMAFISMIAHIVLMSKDR